MKLLFLGDVVGRSGRDVISEKLPSLKRELNLDFIIINGENSASGFGITESIAKKFFEDGADVVTCGDHCFDRSETKLFINRYPNMLRLANFPESLPGKGYNVYNTSGGQKILVIHLQAQLFMKYQVNCPFAMVDKILTQYKLGSNVDYIVVDFHSEATSEKMAMGQYLDGRVSFVVGTHTHIPTADVQILPNGTAYQSDAGMCGDYDSVIGFKKQTPIYSFVNKIRGSNKMTPAENAGTMCGTYVELDKNTGLAKNIDYLRVGGRLKQHIPHI